jgi:MFS family permease
VKGVPAKSNSERKATLAGYVGGTLEYYDMFIYASAATLVFDKVFFSAAGDLSLLVSITTVWITWLVRPLGALLWGHFGDRLSRKQVLVATLMIMGIATFGMGLIPSYDSIGIAAPIVLTFLLILRGLSVAGEAPGAATLIIESAGDKRRGFYGSWVQTGSLSGFVLATLVFIPIAALDQDFLFSWGWRIPFFFSLVLVAVALVIRFRLDDPDVHREFVAEARQYSSPLTQILRDHKAAVVRVISMSLFQGTHQMVTIFGLAYATSIVGVPKSAMLSVLLTVSVIAIGTTPLGGWLSDRYGRKVVFSSGAAACVVAFAAFVFAISVNHSTALIVVAAIVVYSLGYSIGNGSTMALFAEQFPVSVRYSGMAISMQVAGLIYGFGPTLALLVIGNSKERWPLAVAVEALLCVIALIACRTARESAWLPISEVGHPRSTNNLASAVSSAPDNIRGTVDSARSDREALANARKEGER